MAGSYRKRLSSARRVAALALAFFFLPAQGIALYHLVAGGAQSGDRGVQTGVHHFRHTGGHRAQRKRVTGL